MPAVTGSRSAGADRDPALLTPMRALIFLLLALAAPASVQPSAAPRHFSDAELETIFVHVLSLPSSRSAG